MNLQEAKEVMLKYYRIGLEHVVHDPDLNAEKKSDLERFIKHKVGHMARCVSIGKKLLQADGVSTPEEAEQILCGIMVHDIGNFLEMDKERNVSGAKHGPFGKKLLAENEDFSEQDLYQRLIMDMTEQHSALEPSYTDNDFINYGIRLIRDTDKIENIMFLLGDTLGAKRAIYFPKNCVDGPISPEVQKAFDEKRLVDFRDIKTRSDNLLAYAAWGFDLNLDVSKTFWAKNKCSERLVELAHTLSARVAKQTLAPQTLRP